MSINNWTLQKLLTLEELSLAYWEVEKRRMCGRIPGHAKELLKETGEILHDMESVLIRRRGSELLADLKKGHASFSNNLEKVRAIQNGLDDLYRSLEKAGQSVGGAILILEKAQQQRG